MRTIARITTAGLVAAALAAVPVATALSANATPTTPKSTCLTRTQARADQEIAVRLRTLHRLEVRVTTSKRFTAAQKSTYTAVITQDRAGLKALKATIAADTTCVAAKADAAKIVTDYRVFKLLLPQVALTKDIDGQNALAAHLLADAANLQTRISKAAAANKNTTTAQADHDAIITEVGAAQAAINGLADQIAALTPAQVTAGSKPLAFARAALKTGHKDLVAAQAEVVATRKALAAL